MNLSQPMTYEELKAMSLDLQKEYVTKLLDKFGCTKTCLSGFFGINIATVGDLLKRIGIDNSRFKQGARMTKEQQDAFTAWAKTGATIQKQENCVKVERSAQPAKPAEPAKRSELEQQKGILPLFGNTAPMSVTHMEMVFLGKPDANQIANTIRCVSGAKPVCIRISIDEVTNNG